MNWNIIYAVTIGALTAAGAALAGHLSSTKPWHKWVFWGGGLLTVGLIYLQATANEDESSKLLGQLSTLQQTFDDSQRAEVGLHEIGFWPNQSLVPGKPISVQIVFVVRDGVAKNYRVFDEIFTLKGSANGSLDHDAIQQFRKDSVGRLDYHGEDKVKGTGTQKELRIVLNKQEAVEVVNRTRTIYVLGRVEWNGPNGSDFHEDACAWGEPPDQVGGQLDHLGWHMCRQ